MTYKIDDGVRKDLVRCHAKVNIFDMYYDKFGPASLISIEYGPGIASPKTWGAPAPNKPKKREKSNLSQVKKLGLVDKHGRPL